MAGLQKFGVGSSNAGSSFGPAKVGEAARDQFPAGMRILVVDDDVTCLKILERMLRKCEYNVTPCSRAMRALSLIRERKGGFDLIISDVHMPDMDGFKLLELVGLEMDLPVIMMSADARTSTVMKGIKHGACNYLIKPIRLAELKNIWQHVVRKKWSENKDHEQSAGVEDPDRYKREADDAEYLSPVDRADGNWKAQKKRRDVKEGEDDGELENDDTSTSKKPRVVWSIELHQQFVNAVNQLGIDKAVPKRILELMDVPCLTRENVASHLQKFRLYLKRLSTVAQHQGVLPSSFCGPVETNTKVGQFGRLDFQSLAASGQISPKTLGTLHAELLGRPSSEVLPAMELPILLQASLQGPKCIPVESGVTFGQPLVKCPPSISKQFPSFDIAVDAISSGFGTWMPNHLTTLGNTTSIDGLSNQNNNMLVQTLHEQQQQSPRPVLSRPSHATTVQTSSLISPSQSSTSFQVGSNPISISQNTSLVPSHSNSYLVGNTTSAINQNPRYSFPSFVLDHIFMSSQPNNGSAGVGQVMDGNLKNITVLNGSSPGSISSTVPSSLVPSDTINSWRVVNSAPSINPASMLSGFMPNLYDTQSSGAKSINHPDQDLGRNFGFVGSGTCIPSRFAVDDIEFIDDMNQKMSSIIDNGSRVKQEIQPDIMEASKVGNPVLQHFPPSDFMSVLSK